MRSFKLVRFMAVASLLLGASCKKETGLCSNSNGEPLAAGTVCREAASGCDLAATCDGISLECPENAFKPAGTVCRATAGDCDVAESCTGSSAECPTDQAKSAGTVCREAAGDCDLAATCDGTSTACPENGFKTAGTVCRAASDDCDVAESCTGSSAACPADSFKLAGTVCRAAAGDCDAAESCSGSSAACPVDGFKTAGTTCRAAAGTCDAAESCTGSTAQCPADGYLSASTVCRPAAGGCDAVEHCTGSTIQCPSDAFQPATFACHTPAITDPWDVTVMCSGAQAACVRPEMEFDWTPNLLPTSPTHSFVEQATTTAHLIWNGTTWQDTKGHITFVPRGTLPTSTNVGLWSPAQHRVGPWPSLPSNVLRFEADQAHGGNAIDTSGDFTVCVKFKPGTHPGDVAPSKVLVAKGQAEGDSTSHEGWALMQRHQAFSFFYRTYGDGDQFTYVRLGDFGQLDPESWDFAYICGGRAGNRIHDSAHGFYLGEGTDSDGSTVNGSFANPAALPLVIGSYPDGTSRALDEQVYEVIFDSRPATMATMKDIVAEAEQRKLPGGQAHYLGPLAVAPLVDGAHVVGANGSTYTIPPYATIPYDASAFAGGLLAAGVHPRYNQPLSSNTATTGFCFGAEVVADGVWSNVTGGVLGFLNGNDYTNLLFNASPSQICFSATGSSVLSWACANTGPLYSSQSWGSGTRHKIMGCLDPANSLFRVYLDNATTPMTWTSMGPGVTPLSSWMPDLSTLYGQLTIGREASPEVALSGARIARAFACASSDPALCY